ncbi:MAG: hypothetical protein RL095_4085 [Verrucomicrobiota bacterium]|jgi:RND family efflux transporter MFP subunit
MLHRLLLTSLFFSLAASAAEGVLAPSQVLNLPALREGQVQEQLQAGQSGKQGHPLVSVRNLQIETELAMTALQLKAQEEKEAFLKAAMENTRELVKSQTVSAQELRKQEFEARQAGLEKQNLEAKLALLKEQAATQKLSPPFDGKVSKVLKQQGDFARAGDTVCEFIRIHPLHAEIFVAEAQYRRFAAGAQAELLIDGKRVPAAVLSKDPAIDPATGLGKVIFSLPNPDGHFLPGQSFSLPEGK